MLDQQPQASAQVLAPSMSVLSYHEHEQQLHCDAAATNMMNLNDLDEANLLEMLQALTKRRDELRLMDKQLFHLMAGCFVRLKSAGGNRGAKAQLVVSSSGSVSSPSSCSSSSFSSSSAGSTGELGAISTPLLDDGAIDLSRLNVGSGLSSSMESNDHQQGQQQKPKLEDNDQASKGHKRPKFTSPMNQHIKKQRLLSAIISTDDIGEKQQVLAEKELDVRNVDIEQPLTRAYGQRQSIQAIKEDQQASNHHQNKQLTEVVPRMNPSYQQPNSSLHLSSIQQQNLHQFHQFQFQLKLQDEFQQQQQQHQSDYSSLAKSLVAQPLAVYEQHHHQHFFDVAAALQQQFDTGNNSSASDQDEEGAQEANVHGSSRPQLKKFCSIGTAEMSFERFSRQQHLIDSTLATLAHQHQQASQQQQHLLVPIGNSMKPNSMSELMVQNQQQTSNCFSLSLPSSSSSSSSYTSCSSSSGSPVNTNKFVFSPFMMTVPSHQPQAPGSHRAQFYNELLCHQKTLTSASHQVEVPSGIAAGIYSTIQPVEPIPQQQPATQKCGSTFDRMLANAKELAPIVKKMPFRCHVCSSCFEDRHRLQQHLSIHLNLHPSWFEEKTIKETMAQYELRRGDYLCQVCQLRYETTSEFDKHMHSHGEKPHQCELCSQDNKFVSFRYFRQLLTHLRSHCFLYSCRFVPECRQTANRKDYLKLHILKHHLNNKLPEQYTICCH